MGHEGVDTEKVKPRASARFTLPGGETLHKGHEIVTYVSRNLEPMRGFHIFMRALPKVLRERPNARALIVGGDGCSYGAAPQDGISWKATYLDENARELDLSRVHFVDRLSYEDYLSVLQLSRVHVYMTYPFVLSWSLLEAMSAGCKIVASDTAPVREVVDASNGILVPFLDSRALSDAIVNVLSRPQKYADMSKAARATILDRYDQKSCIPSVMQLMGIDHELSNADV